MGCNVLCSINIESNIGVEFNSSLKVETQVDYTDDGIVTFISRRNKYKNW